MRIVNLNTFDQGGAAIACINQHCGLLEAGVDSYLITLSKSRSDIPNHISYHELFPKKQNSFFSSRFSFLNRNHYKKEIRQLAKSAAGHFSFNDSKYDLTRIDLIKEADIVNLHWVANFINWKTFFPKLNHKKFVWTLHDMGPFTGGYHYANGFRGYETDDKGYPALSKTKYHNFSFYALNEKKKILRNNNISLNIVADSKWLAKCAYNSALFSNYDIRTIYYGFDTDIFVNKNSLLSRKNLKLPQLKNIVLFVCQNINVKRKGFSFLLNSLNSISQKNIKNILLCSVGEKNNSFGINCGVKYIDFGFVRDQKKLADIYNAVDLFVIPSIEEAFGQTTVESLLCGTPVVGFPVGGIREVIIDGFNGFLCEEISSHNLGLTISKAIDNMNLFHPLRMRNNAIDRFEMKKNAINYINLYKNILENNNV